MVQQTFPKNNKNFANLTQGKIFGLFIASNPKISPPERLDEKLGFFQPLFCLSAPLLFICPSSVYKPFFCTRQPETFIRPLQQTAFASKPLKPTRFHLQTVPQIFAINEISANFKKNFQSQEEILGLFIASGPKHFNSRVTCPGFITRTMFVRSSLTDIPPLAWAKRRPLTHLNLKKYNQ